MMNRATVIPRLRNVNRHWLSCIVLAAFGLAGSTAFALDLLGPPAGGLKQGQFHVGLDYSYGEMDLELDAGRWVEHLDGVFLDAGKATSFTLKDFETATLHANLGYGIADNWDVFLRLGGTDCEFGDSIWLDGESFDSGAQMAIGAGVKGTFYEEGKFRLGGIFQVGWAEYDGKLKAPHWAAADLVEIDITEVQIAVGPTYQFTERFSMYGGPFLHFVDGDLKDRVSEWTEDGLLTSRYSWRVTEDSVLGAYIGARVDLTDNCSVNFECQLTSAAEAIALGLLWRF